jgi:FixJ family two-component response regulator
MSINPGSPENKMRESTELSKSARISIVDDDKSMREAIETLIWSVGLSVEQFSSAEDFLESGPSRNIDCLILDVRMPGMGGLELQQRLAAAGRSAPTVFITAHYIEEEHSKAMAGGAVDFLTKPFTEQALLDAIAASLALSTKIANRVDEDIR